MASKTKKENGKKPDIKSERFGTIDLAGWKKHIVIPVDEEKNPYGMEREFDVINICLNAGKKVNGKWENDTLWINSRQFANLVSAVEDFSPKLKELANSVEKQLEEEVGSK